MSEKNSKEKKKIDDTAKLLKQSTLDYFAMLNESVTIFNQNRETVEKEIARGGRLTKHQLTL